LQMNADGVIRLNPRYSVAANTSAPYTLKRKVLPIALTGLELKSPEIRTELRYVEVRGRLADAVNRALADEVSRKILASAAKEGRTIGEVSSEQAIPQSTCYRRMNDLLREGLVVIDRIMVTQEARYAIYRSCFSACRLASSEDFTNVSVEVVINQEIADKVKSRWISMTLEQSGGITR
jgi:DNA-binding transcriptional ArsR family regulator